MPDRQASFSLVIIANALLPSLFKIFLAVFLPHPFTIGDARNARICSSVCGMGLSHDSTFNCLPNFGRQLKVESWERHDSTFNCLPNFGWVSHSPITVISSFLSTP